MIHVIGTLNGSMIDIPCNLNLVADDKKKHPYTIDLAPLNLGTPVDADIISAIEFAINDLHFYKDQRTISYDDTASYVIDWELEIIKDNNSPLIETEFNNTWKNIKSEHTLNS